MKRSELRNIIKEELKGFRSADENMSEKHIAQIKDMLNTLSIMKTELDNAGQVGDGRIDRDIKKLAVTSTDNLFELAKLIKKNTKWEAHYESK